MAVRVSAESGFDPGYMLKGQAEQTTPERMTGGYHINAAQAGEAPGRWFGKGAEALGFGEGQVVEAGPFLAVYSQVHPVTGERLGRAPGGYAKTKDILARLLAGEPHATGERRLELEREAAQQTRRSPAYTDVTASYDKTISIVHAAIREQERRARLAGDEQAQALWAAREARWQEILREGNRRGLEHLQQMAGWTRTGYHGKRVDGVEPGRWERALPVVTSWLQGTNRKGEPHDHSHNLWARMSITESDGKWRALDTMRIRGHLGAMSAVVAAYVESAMTREFGVQWVRRADGMGNEIAGVTEEWKDAFSTRTLQVDAKEKRLALQWHLRFGREPTAREMLFPAHRARLLAQSKRRRADRLADRPVFYPRDKLGVTDLGYAVTGHTGQGGTVTRGEAVFCGGEPREWVYVALTRGQERNTARVITHAQAADPMAGTQADPELARAELVQRERTGLPPEPGERDFGLREPVAVLADCLDREAGEEPATEYQRNSLARADQLGLLHARWADQVKAADQERYHRIVQDALPQDWRGQLSPKATWLYRTMKAAELAGLDPAEVTQTAIRSRSLDGTRDVAAVLDARMQAMTEPLVPLPQGRWSERVPEIADPDRQQYVRRLAAAMDDRAERIGEHAAWAQPEWALCALGPVPEEPAERLDWQQRASLIGAYRELYGAGDQADPLGPEPAGSSPEQRADWHAAYAALTRTDTVDVRTLPEASLWHMRDSYHAETGWAPPHVGRLLRGIRRGHEDARQQEIRSAAEAKAAADPQTVERHASMAASARALQDIYRSIEATLEETMDDRRAWEAITAGPRRLAVAADSELRRRNPDTAFEPLRSAEPRAPEYDDITSKPAEAKPAEPPEWVTRLAERRQAFQAKLAERQNVMVPEEDPDWGYVGLAWPWQEPDPDAILQPPKPELRPCAGIEHLAGREIPDREAGD